MTEILGLGGGIGASRLSRVLAQAAGTASLTLAINTGDDLWLHGLRICPDLDTNLYALSGLQDLERGWGIAGDTQRSMSALARLGGETWFGLGDLDLGTHLLRTGLIRGGLTLSQVTAQIATALGVKVRLMPMSDDEVTTIIGTADGRQLHYQEYLVREACAPQVNRFRFKGIRHATPAPGLLDAIGSADVIIIAPSNPVASVLPILGLPGVSDALAVRRDAVVAVSPIVSNTPITDPGELRRSQSRAVLLGMAGVPATSAGVARLYRDICSRFVYDPADGAEAPAIKAEGIDACAAPLLLHLGAPAADLLRLLGARHEKT